MGLPIGNRVCARGDKPVSVGPKETVEAFVWVYTGEDRGGVKVKEDFISNGGGPRVDEQNGGSHHSDMACGLRQELPRVSSETQRSVETWRNAPRGCD
jgi:hypothetical protein